MKGLAEVLAEHEPHTAQGGVYCECEQWGRHYDRTGSKETYAAHVEAAVLDWVREWLGSADVETAARAGIAHRQFGHAATAALAAAAQTLGADQ